MLFYLLILYIIFFLLKNIFKNRKIIDSKETGLRLGLIFNNLLSGSDDLHYGYFTSSKDIRELSFEDFKIAQENHSQLIIDHIPENTEKILDVGSGSGILAKKLINKGYQVDCVSPDKYLSQRIAKNTNNKVEIFNSIFEDVNTDKKYDLILFSESYQYIDIDTSFEKINKFLKDDGYFLICDCFQKDNSNMRGGHNYVSFCHKIKNTTFALKKHLDITDEASKTYDFISNVYQHIDEAINIIHEYSINNFPYLSYLISFVMPSSFKTRIDKFRRETGAYFKENKYYYLLLYKKKEKTN